MTYFRKVGCENSGRLDDQVERVFDGFVDLSVMADLAGLFLGRALEIFDQFIANLKVGNEPSADEGFFAAKIDFLHGNLRMTPG